LFGHNLTVYPHSCAVAFWFHLHEFEANLLDYFQDLGNQAEAVNHILQDLLFFSSMYTFSFRSIYIAENRFRLLLIFLLLEESLAGRF
jgi:hypothetical protein